MARKAIGVFLGGRGEGGLYTVLNNRIVDLADVVTYNSVVTFNSQSTIVSSLLHTFMLAQVHVLYRTLNYYGSSAQQSTFVIVAVLFSFSLFVRVRCLSTCEDQRCGRPCWIALQ